MKVLDSVDLDAIRALHTREEFFWLDLDTPSDADLDALGELLEIPNLAIEDSKEFGQRPKIDEYGTRVLLVFYGAHAGRLVEVHVHISGSEVVTIRREPCWHLWDARERATTAHVRTEQELVYRVLDALAESLTVLVDGFSDEVERLENLAFERPKPDERRRMSQLRAELFRLQQIITPQRDMLGRGGDLLENLPGLERDVVRHPFRDVHDDLVVTANTVDYLREVLAETASVLVNQIAGRLTIVATVFLPLTFATGFFGMNFGWLVRHIDSAETFFVLGIGGMILPLIVVAVLLVRSGYLVRR
jgi:magnesium transporter